MDRRAWLLYGFSVVSGFAALPCRVVLGWPGLSVVGLSIAITLWLAFRPRTEIKHQTVVLLVNLAGLTVGASLSFLVLGKLSPQFLLGVVDPGEGFALGQKWALISCLLHCVLAYSIWWSNRQVVEFEVPRGPLIPENLNEMSDEEKQRYKNELDEWMSDMEVQLEVLKSESKRKMVWAFVCIGGGAVLMVGAILSGLGTR